MQYAKIENGTIAATGRPRGGDRRLDTGQWVTPYNDHWAESELEACGWSEVVETAKPDGRVLRSVELLDGVPTVVWSEVVLSAEDVALEAEQATDQAVKDAARAELEALASSDDPGLSALAAAVRTLVDTLQG